MSSRKELVRPEPEDHKEKLSCKSIPRARFVSACAIIIIVSTLSSKVACDERADSLPPLHRAGRVSLALASQWVSRSLTV
jgi:hypothetical protein